MPIEPEAYQNIAEEELRDQAWFAKKLGDLIWSPGTTQGIFEENVRQLRAEYQTRNMDGIFMTMFARMRKTLDGGKAPEVADAGITVRMVYTSDDFLYTEYPYEEIFAEENLFRRDQIMAQLEKQARSVGVRNFKSLYNQYERSQKDQGNKTHSFGVPRMDCGELQLDPGDWKMDSTGIFKDTLRGREYACSHNIAPVRRLRNIDSGEEKLTLAYERSGSIRYVTKPKRELFDGAKVLDLASIGVAVTSKTGKTLAQYLCEIEGLNYDEIPQQDSVARLGYLDDGRFSPYVEDLIFDGDAAYGTFYKSICEKGSYEKWLSAAIECRNYNIIAQIMLASSFASVLLKKMGALPFFVHLWGGGSGTGKTVAMMLAASVWGNPELGQYPITFDGTDVGFERIAAFLGNLPMCIDELQVSAKNARGKPIFDVYRLAQGVGRTRGNKQGGIDKAPTWSLCCLTTGESPIVQNNAGAGAVNRVIDIECKPADIELVIKDGKSTSRILRKNYGFAGRKFIESLTDEKIEIALKMYDNYFALFLKEDTTEKQAMAAALILTADAMADREIFHTGKVLQVKEMSEFLKSRASVSVGERGYAFICDWVAVNVSKFSGESSNSDAYGIIDGDHAYINRSVFRKACTENGFDERALLSWMKSRGLILTRGRNFTRGKRIAGVNVECVAMKMPDCGVPTEKGELL